MVYIYTVYITKGGVVLEKKDALLIEPIAYIKNGYKEKFGVPRQSGLAPSVKSVIEFCPEYRDENCIRDIEQYSHLWLLWGFSKNENQWSPTVRPPRLGGNKRVGVFATRSPFRPNPIGLSCVKLLGLEKTENQGIALKVCGADLMNGTPIYDIKPYIRYADSRPDARCGYVDSLSDDRLSVNVPSSLAEKWSDRIDIPALIQVLELDPRPSYQNDPDRVYGMKFMDYDVRFTVDGNVLSVIDLVSL